MNYFLMTQLATLARRMNGVIVVTYDGEVHKVWEARFQRVAQCDIVFENKSLRRALKALKAELDDYYANHWRDDDTPEYECGYGTC